MTSAVQTPAPPEALSILQERAAVIEHRLGRLEKTAEAPADRPPEPKHWSDTLQALSSLLTPIAVLGIGYLLNDSVNAAFKTQELHLSNVIEMRQLLETLQSAEVTAERAQATAFTLSAFGMPAVAPLLTILSVGDDVRRPAAEKALRAVGMTTPAPVCAAMIKVIDNRSSRFNWLTHASALRLIGDLECRDAEPALQRYQVLLQGARSPESVQALRGVIDPDPPVDLDAAKQLSAELERARTIVRAH